MSRPASPTWELFCTVVDNYGDIGITWRLARQLAQEHGLHVRLWVDDLVSFHALRPEIDPDRPTQLLEGVQIHRWDRPFPEVPPADVVIEAFACQLPDNHVRAMAARTPRPVWINLEYLSAEDWVAGCHGLPSPHPRLPLTKWFFFPGFTPDTGGLLREAGLLEAVHAFQASAEAQSAFWLELGVPPRKAEELRISLFGYENRASAGLLRQWADAPMPVRCLLPAGRLAEDVLHFFGRADLAPQRPLQRGRLTVHCLPMLSQDRYDRLLWACDCNFVRGEDSFVRAQWAGRPLVWQAYPQEGGAHRAKIEAFLSRYGAGLPEPVARDQHRLWTAWNETDAAAIDWWAWWRHRPTLEAHARRWSEHLGALGDLAGNLVRFCRERL
jgi:uncharacterized repeat protein (TIGR03837 family)